jgi:hypothetical protein
MGSDSSQTPIDGCESTNRKLEAEALHKRFQEFAILANPLDFPFAKQLMADAVPVSTVPLIPERSQSAFLGVRVVWRNLELHLRQPDPASLLICNIERAASTETLGSPLLALSSFLRYAVHRSDLIEVIGGCVSKAQNAGEGDLAFPRLRDFYTRLVGDLHEYRDIDVVWLFGLTRRPSRYTEQKIWQRR